MALETEVIEVVAHSMRLDKTMIKPESSYIGDLGADSLDMIEVFIALEEEFEIKIPDEMIENLKTVQITTNYIQEQLAKKK